MSLVGFFAGARDIVPESDAGIERESEDVATVGGEADCGYGGIVFVDEGAETLTCCCIPNSTGSHALAPKLEKT